MVVVLVSYYATNALPASSDFIYNHFKLQYISFQYLMITGYFGNTLIFVRLLRFMYFYVSPPYMRIGLI